MSRFTPLTTKIVPMKTAVAAQKNDTFVTSAVDLVSATGARIVWICSTSDIAVSSAKLQWSNDNVTFADVPNSAMVAAGLFPAVNNENKIAGWTIQRLAGQEKGSPPRRYYRVSYTLPNGTNGLVSFIFAEIFDRVGMGPNAESSGFLAIVEV